MRKPRIYWKFYPRLRRAYWKVDPIPPKPTLQERSLWSLAYMAVETANRKMHNATAART